MIPLLVAAGAIIGAPARYLTDRAVQSRHNSRFPFGTLTVNVAACLVFGVMIGLAGHVDDRVQALVTTGFCGTLSTYSTFSVETVRLVQDGRRGVALCNVLVSLGIGLAAVAGGYALGRA